jgi:hypothetical protein
MWLLLLSAESVMSPKSGCSAYVLGEVDSVMPPNSVLVVISMLCGDIGERGDVL